MLFACIGIFIFSFACAYASVHLLRGRAGFWIFYAVAVLGGPSVFGGLAFLLYRGTDRAVALDLGQFIMAIGLAVAALAYPIQHWRCRREAGR